MTIQEEAETVWRCWTEDQHVIRWNFTSADWHCPVAANDLREGGEFQYEMAAKDGSSSVTFSGTYIEVDPLQKISLILEDGRRVKVFFERVGNTIVLTVKFEPEDLNSHELQQQRWQAILDNFARYVHSK